MAPGHFQGVATEGAIAGRRALLLLPGTFMNESGRAVGEAAHFYKTPLGDIAVFHDEIDLPPAKLRVKVGGGIAGHNGLRSISEHIGNDYRRVRIGVGHPGDKDMVQHYVLSDFAKSERGWLEALLAIIADNAELIVRGEDASFQNKVHLAMAGQRLWRGRGTTTAVAKNRETRNGSKYRWALNAALSACQCRQIDLFNALTETAAAQAANIRFAPSSPIRRSGGADPRLDF